MTDDQSQDALGIYGNKILKTPNMDRIGNEGIRFDKGFVTTSVCAPSRASYLTGLYAHSHGVTSNGEEPGWYDQMGLRPDQITYPMLRSEEHTSELQSLMRISYAVFCLKKKKKIRYNPNHSYHSS